MNHQCPALKLNDSGIYRLLEHNFEEAVLFFGDAVFLTNAIMIQQEQESSSSYHQYPPCPHRRLDLQLDFIDLECYRETMTHEKFCSLNGSNDNMLVCKTAISICSHSSMLGTDGAGAPSANHIATAGSVTYNLAIALHLWALQLGSKEKLRMALYYYEVAYRLQQQQETTESSSTLVMSILNNVATIFHVLGDHGVSKLFLQELMAMLPYVHNTRQPMLNGQNQGVSWENILCLMLGPPTAASAA